MWKLLFQSVRGTSHERSGQPCQDSCLVRLQRARAGPVLILVCADGAGSARHSDAGARVACRSAVRLILDDLYEGLPVAHIDRDTVLSWFKRLQPYLREEARAYLTDVEQVACTLLLAVIADDAAAFAQVGDGAIIIRDGSGYQPVFWPQNGEYANTTFFVTDPDFEQHLAFELQPRRIEELAMFTDGLQSLALKFADRSVHQPFFEPMFRKLRASASGERLPAALREFLTSPAVNERSDDDKTLLLATRVPARDSAPDPI